MNSQENQQDKKDRQQNSGQKSTAAIITLGAAAFVFIVIVIVIVVSKNRNTSSYQAYTDDDSIHVGNDKSYVHGDAQESSQAQITPSATVYPSSVLNTPTPSLTPRESTAPTPKQSPSPTLKPTSTPKQTAEPSKTPTPEPTPTPNGSQRDKSVGKFSLSDAAYEAYETASAKEKLTFSFDLKESPENRNPVKGYRHDGMTFSEWKNKIKKCLDTADEILIGVKSSENPTEYNVDITKYPWASGDKIKGKYGAYYPYLPEKWFECMDYYLTNSKTYETEWDNALRAVAEEDAAWLASFGGSARVEKSGLDYIVVCTISKLNFEKAGNSSDYVFYVDIA